MAKIQKKSIQQVKDSVRISDVFEWLGARVVRKGSNTMAFCPFCEDAHSKSPGCSLNDELGLFHCFTADTKIITSKGVKEISDVLGAPVEILNGNGEWEEVEFHSYGKQTIWNLTIDVDGQRREIHTTDGHRWPIADSDLVKLTKDLASGDRLSIVHPADSDARGAQCASEVTVISVDPMNAIEEVFCCQTSTTTFALDGYILTGNCFVCQESGDTITAVMLHEDLNFPEAVEMLGAQFNIELEYEQSSDPEAESRRKRLVTVLEAAQEEFIAQRSDPHYKEFLESRNITEEAADRFDLGISLYTEANAVLARLVERFGEEDVINSGIAYRDEEKNQLFLRFRNRLMFPIRTTPGTLVGFGGRDLTGKSRAKYKNSPENELFKKRNILYGMNLAKKQISKQKKAIVCEGHMDTLALQSHGFEYAVGAMGTALTEQNLRLLSTFADTIYISLDSDAAGVAAAKRTAETLPPDFRSEVKVLIIPEVECANEEEVRKTSLAKADEYLFDIVVNPDGSTSKVPVEFPVMVPMAKDPDEFFNQVGHTVEEFAELIEQSIDIFLFCAMKSIEDQVAILDAEMAKEESDTVVIAQAKMEARRNLDDLMARLYRKTNVYQRQNIANYAISVLRLVETAKQLEDEWKKRAVTAVGSGGFQQKETTTVDASKLGMIKSSMTTEEDLLIATLYFHPETRNAIRENIEDLKQVFTSAVRYSVFEKIDAAYGQGRTALQAQKEDMDEAEIKEISRIVMNIDADEESKRELSEDTIKDICNKMEKHALENAIEMESQAASPNVLKIIEMKMKLAKL